MSVDRLIICLPPLRGVHPINFSHAHNEKSCPVTIDKTLRYEGVQVVVCANYRQNRLTFLMIRAINRTQTNDKKQQ